MPRFPGPVTIPSREGMHLSTTEGAEMKKTLGMIALTGGLVATGCAMLPTTGAKAPAAQPTAVGLSGPGTAVVNMAGADRNIQVVGGGAKFVYARIYQADSGSFGTAFAASDSIETFASKILTASGSVTTAGVATLTLPSLPAGKHVIQVNGYNTLTPDINWTTGADNNAAAVKATLVAQGEAYVETEVGMPYTAKFNMFAKFPGVLDATTSATYSISTTLVSVPVGGIAFRMMDWNHYGNLSASQTIRVVIQNPTKDFTNTIATTSAAAYWQLGHIQAAEGFQATQSFGTWNWGPGATPNKRYIYTDLDLTSATLATKYATNSFAVGQQGLGSLSFVMPTTLAPAGVKIYLHDLGKAGSGDGTPTL